ncbi:alpha-galactosidase [Bifidobacterium aemilianum]|uniref:alpha-galactosidase n=1 Tax=Bifidobacterium aemilianum TaxID=2493120 RepID=A0A366K9D5_9BIFI|nr:alpha-galactosidase [Bifidobacterium aemilianum]RBP97778.1 alpha-galactosidase [Bifidobacterium aemilianum]
MLFPSVTSPSRAATRILLTDPVLGADLPSAVTIVSSKEAGGYETGPYQGQLARPLLAEHALNSYIRPSLRGQRLTAQTYGRDWSPRFTLTSVDAQSDCHYAYRAQDADAGLELLTEMESLPGGSLRIRHSLTNTGQGDYLLDGLEVRLPLADDQTEILDFTGRHEHERTPQRRELADGMWLREGRRGKPNFEGNLLIVGTPGFDFHHGSIVMVQPAWSGNAVLAVDRSYDQEAGIVAGELLLPGELVLRTGQTYTMPWIVVTASDQGLDQAAQSLHAWERSLPEHPSRQPVTLNVWEAVGFDQDFGRLKEIAQRAASIGVERYVLDDGWFHLRRDDYAGLGDWWVAQDVWPQGLKPLADYVHGLGMQFGLWFEPEMVNQDSDLYREHPEWIMQASARTPELQRHQLMLDLSNTQAFDHVFTAMCQVLDECPVDCIKWDHNRALLESGSNQRHGAPAVHQQTQAYYRLLDALRERYPQIEWESCASGGGRIDPGVIEKVKRFWTSDMTDALSRQQIQRWTLQTVAPEYIGAHISQPSSQQSGRTFSLAFRAPTAVFFSFGIEWDISTADSGELEELASWISWYKEHRDFLHSGLVNRFKPADPTVFAYGVIAEDRSRALVAQGQYEESDSDRGSYLRIPGLLDQGQYRLRWTGPEPARAAEEVMDPYGPLGQQLVSGRYLATVGIRIPRCMPETMRLIDIELQ